MSDRVEVFQVLVPANTAQPGAITQLALARQGNVVDIKILVPDGPNGLTGIALLYAGVQQVPFVGGTYLVANNESLDFPIQLPLDTAQWSALAYNLGKYPHTFYLRFGINEIVIPSPTFLPSPTFQFLPLGP